MGHWKKSEIFLGVIKAGTPKKIVFEGLETLPKIVTITPYCGCTVPYYNEAKKEMVVLYSNKSIPNQVQGPQSISKRIDVTYDTGLSEVLIIKATRIR